MESNTEMNEMLVIHHSASELYSLYVNAMNKIVNIPKTYSSTL